MGKPRTETPIYRAWFPAQQEEEDAREWGALDVKSAANLHANYFYRHRDGYECRWPLTCLVLDPDGNRWAVSVEMELVAEFNTAEALPLAMKEATHVLFGSEAFCSDPRLDVGADENWPPGQAHVTLRQIILPTGLVDEDLLKTVTCEKCAKRAKNHLEIIGKLKPDQRPPL